ncbi:MAG: hypothetical protein LC795_11895 [Acidobacteria bacterium]|nr:hypothetical protein [Acidobacteriota bacterium]
MADLLEALGGQLIERRAISLLVPSLLFWAGGLGAYLSCSGWALLCSPRLGVLCSAESCSRWPALRDWLAGLPTPWQWSLLGGGVLLIFVSAVVIERFVPPALRLLEGYWPRWLNFLQRRVIRRQTARADRERRRFGELRRKERNPSAVLTREERREMAALDFNLMHAPSSPQLRMPTELGNILRTAELRPRDKYGLNSIVCWPRLWLVLPESAKGELGEARAGLDTAVRTWLWSVLFTVWAMWAWWAVPLGLLGALFCYRWAVAAAAVYGELLEATYDVHRWSLYAELHWPPPANPAEEKKVGEALTSYLYRGSDSPTPDFITYTEQP